MNQEPVRASLPQLLLVLTIFIIAVVFCVAASANSDPLWFLPYFNETPARIIVYREGCRVELLASSAGFAEITAALNETLAQVDGYEQGYGLSPETYKQFTEKERAVQVFYPRRVTIHVAYRFGNPDSLFFPLSGYYADGRAVFGGIAGDYWAGALRLKSIAPIQRAVEPIRCS